MIVKAVVNAENVQKELQEISFEIKDVIIGIHKNFTTISIKGSRNLDVSVIILKSISTNRNYVFRLPLDKLYVLNQLKGITEIEYDDESGEIRLINC